MEDSTPTMENEALEQQCVLPVCTALGSPRGILANRGHGLSHRPSLPACLVARQGTSIPTCLLACGAQITIVVVSIPEGLPLSVTLT